MFYERPKKKRRRAPETDMRAQLREYESEAENDFPGRRHAWSTGREDMYTARRRVENARKKERFSLIRFLFETPRKAEEPAYEEGYLEPDEVPKAGKRKKHYVLKFLFLILALSALCAFLLYILPVSFFGFRNADAFLADNDLPGGYVHVLLIGVDKDTSGTSRSDTMMIASVSKGDVKLTSLMRDTGVSIPGKSGKHRLNAAYAYGGAELLIQTVNENFALDITRYALVDYESFPKLIDLIGGVDIAVTEAEMEQINRNTREVLYRKVVNGENSYEDGLAEYERSLLHTFGENTHLSGIQALSYARIRNLDSDYGRTNRQRKLLSAAVGTLKGYIYKPLALAGVATSALDMVETNMTVPEILSLGLKAVPGSGSISQMRLPVTGTYTDNGGMFQNVDYAANRKAFISFVYGDQKAN